MLNRIFKKNISISFLEQLSQSLGNFIFFILSGRIAGPEQFGLFGFLLVGTQLILSISVQWILLPITSRSINFSNRQIINQFIRKTLFLFLFSPFFIWFYSKLLSDINFDLNQYFLVYILSIAMVLAEISRYFLIRLRFIKILLISNFSKWLFSYILIINYLENSQPKYLTLLNIFVFTLIFGLLIQGILYLKYRKKIPNNQQKEERLKVREDISFLGLGAANVFYTLTTTILFNRINILAFGAFQAFRSIINFYPFILQFLETHYSAILVNKSKTDFIRKYWLKIYLILTFIISIILFLKSKIIVEIFYGANYLGYRNILFLQFLIVSIQSISRLITVELRLKSKNIAFAKSSLILITFSSVLWLIYFYNQSLLNYLNLIIFILITALTQLINYFLYTNYIKN